MRAAYSFTTFADGLDTMRRIVQRGATPAVLRLYDATEADRSYKTGAVNLLLMLDEGDAHVTEATRHIVEEECIVAGADATDVAFVEQWLEHRNDVSALEALISRGLVVDTMEIAGSWRGAARHLRAHDRSDPSRSNTRWRRRRTRAIPTSTAGASTSRSRGVLRSTEREAYYRAVWDAGQRAVLAAGGALSHHHGVGLNRARFVGDALGAGMACCSR